MTTLAPNAPLGNYYLGGNYPSILLGRWPTLRCPNQQLYEFKKPPLPFRHGPNEREASTASGKEVRLIVHSIPLGPQRRSGGHRRVPRIGRGDLRTFPSRSPSTGSGVPGGLGRHGCEHRLAFPKNVEHAGTES